MFGKDKNTKRTENDFLAEEEIERIFNVTKQNPYENAITQVFYCTTQRTSSVIELNVKDFDPIKKILTFHKMKRGEDRPIAHKVLIDDMVVSAIQEYLTTRKDVTPQTPLFVNKTLQTRLNREMLRRHFKDLAIRANIPREKNVYVHMFGRKSAITHMKKRGCQDSDNMKISEHTDPKSLKSYDCTDIDDIRTIVEKYTTKFESSPPQPPKPVIHPPQQIPELKQDSEKDEMKRVIQELLDENKKLKENKYHNSMFG